MRLARRLGLGLLASITFTYSAVAEAGFRKVSSETEFLQVTSGKNMTIMGITVFVTPDGQIGGRAFGQPVSGAWEWRSGYFCRDLYWGKRDFSPNCQEVRVDGNKIRFASDRGKGQSAVLTLR